jgi:serine/threonine-protein kinase
MPSHLKQLVRARMAKTGESYQTALRHVRISIATPAPSATPDGQLPSGGADSRIGTVLAGRYRLVRVLSEPPRPGFPTILYRAEGTLLGGEVDIKLLSKSAPAHLRPWVLREGRALRRAAHPQVVRVFDIGESAEGDLYLALEATPKMTLSQCLEGAEPDDGFALRVIRQLARILERVHQTGVVHRGLRNDVVYLDESGDDLGLKLSGFDFADLEGEPELTSEGAVYGHPRWMSPEECDGAKVDARSDLYALGILLYTMLALRHPFSSEENAELLRMQRREPPPPLRAPGAAASPLDAVCLKLLRKNPDDRYQSARELLSALPPLSG